MDERFAGPETQIFHRSGIHAILYAYTIADPDIPNLTYVIPFIPLEIVKRLGTLSASMLSGSRCARNRLPAGGKIVAYQNLWIWRAALFSPIQ